MQAGLRGKIGAGNTEGIGDRLHGVSSRTGDGERNNRFFGCINSSASRSTSFSKVFLPSMRVPVERDHRFRWKMITQSGAT